MPHELSRRLGPAMVREDEKGGFATFAHTVIRIRSTDQRMMFQRGLKWQFEAVKRLLSYITSDEAMSSSITSE